MPSLEIPVFLEWLCTGAFALSGVLAARNRKVDLDIFGVMVVGVVTAVGGGTLRDSLLDVPIFWLTRSDMLYWAMAVSLVGFFAARHLPRKAEVLVDVLDAVGLAIFSIYGAHKAQLLGAPWLSCVYMGMLTGIGGGIMRDMLTAQVPLIMRQEVYATAAIAGTLCAVFLPGAWGLWTGMLLCFLLRLAAIRWKLSLPMRGW